MFIACWTQSVWDNYAPNLCKWLLQFSYPLLSNRLVSYSTASLRGLPPLVISTALPDVSIHFQCSDIDIRRGKKVCLEKKYILWLIIFSPLLIPMYYSSQALLFAVMCIANKVPENLGVAASDYTRRPVSNEMSTYIFFKQTHYCDGLSHSTLPSSTAAASRQLFWKRIPKQSKDE